MILDWCTREGGEIVSVTTRVRFSRCLPSAFRLHREESQRDRRRMAAYFRAVAVMLQVPGGEAYAFRETRDRMDAVIETADAATVRALLRACLGRLGAEELMAQMPGGRAAERRRLPARLTRMLERRGPADLLNVAAECLDELIVRPAWRASNSPDRTYTGHWDA